MRGLHLLTREAVWQSDDLVVLLYSFSAGHECPTHSHCIAGHDRVISRVGYAIAPWNSKGRFVSDGPMQIEDDQRYQGWGSLASKGPVSLMSTTTGSSNQDADTLQQQLQYVTAGLNAANASNAQYWRHQSRISFNCQHAGFQTAARQFEHAAQDQTDMEVARATPRPQADMITDHLRMEHLAEDQRSIQQMQLPN